MEITVNGRVWQVDDAFADSPLLWVLRDELGLVGTKFGCGIGTCGACTIHVNGEAVRSCQTTPADIFGQQVTTIEGLATTVLTDALHPVQQAWIDHSVPQCGYCQAGQIMSAAALLAANPTPSDADIDRDMSGNLCRCGTYARIRSAIKQAAKDIQSGGELNHDTPTIPQNLPGPHRLDRHRAHHCCNCLRLQSRSGFALQK